MDIDHIIWAIQGGRVKVTGHADEEAANDNLIFEDIIHAVCNGEVIEDYPNDTPYPSCLIFGHSPWDEPIHSVWAYNPETYWVVLITVYRPDF